MTFVTSCWRCDRWHERVCALCKADPACADHNCWSMAELYGVTEDE